MKQCGAASMASCTERVSPWDEPAWRGIDGLMPRSKRARALSLAIVANAYGSLSTLDCNSLSLSLLASLCTLPSCLLGPNPFFCHPALLGPNHCLLPTTHFADRTSHLSSLFPRGCSFVRPHCAVTSNFASTIHPPSNPIHPVSQHPWPGGMREAIK